MLFNVFSMCPKAPRNSCLLFICSVLGASSLLSNKLIFRKHSFTPIASVRLLRSLHSYVSCEIYIYIYIYTISDPCMLSETRVVFHLIPLAM